MSCQDRITNFLNNRVISIEIMYNVLLAHYTTMRVGGSTPVMLFPNTLEDFLALLQFLDKEDISYFILGKGSNLIVNDEGVDISCINTERLTTITLDPFNNMIQVDAGVSLTDLSKFAYENGLTGLEFACGIPGTTGGAVFMNAGAYGEEMKDILFQSEGYDPKKGLIILNNKEHEFSYRKSVFVEKQAIVLRSSFILKKGTPVLIKEKMNDLMQRREDKQPLELSSAGSTFKRPEGYFAGQLIADAGLKGYKKGNAGVSTKHAGFVVNLGGAKAKDILELIIHIQNTVQEKFGVSLEPEVKFLEKDGTFRNFS